MAEGVAARAAHLEEVAPGYLDKVRRAASRLAAYDGESAGLRESLAAVEGLASIDSDVPTLSRQRSLRLLKAVVKKLVGWYLRYLGDQVSALGQALARLGNDLVDRSEELEAEVAALRRDLGRLADRVRLLEQGLGGGPGQAGGLPAAGRAPATGAPEPTGQ